MSDEQSLLLDTSTRFIDEFLPMERIRALTEGEPVGHEHLSAVAELGWFAMFVPEDLGGGSVSGDPVADAVLLAQLRGRRLLPEPYVASNAVATALGAAAPGAVRDSLLADLAAGKGTATIAVTGDALWGGSDLSAQPSGADLLLRGTAIIDDPGAEWMLLTAATADGPAQVLLEAGAVTSRSRRECLDLTRSLEAVDLDGVAVPPDHVFSEGLDRARDTASLLSVAESVGAAERLFEMTREYALDRFAFGRPIGSFQAIKHLLADVSTVVESMKAVLAGATRAVSEMRSYASEVVSIAAVYVGERSARMAQDCLQVHGGIGFAWEHDLHLYMRRLTTNAAFYGTTDFHRGRILAAHAAELENA
ncbi:acyl-CoA dehydrogenase family protein [Prescottella defluvii]|nr:acyl-CoA dehydrogenase family protein [Prescottella defluvii]